jgi:hypothetical protein
LRFFGSCCSSSPSICGCASVISGLAEEILASNILISVFFYSTSVRFFNSTSANLKLFGMASECEEEIVNGIEARGLKEVIVKLKAELAEKEDELAEKEVCSI